MSDENAPINSCAVPSFDLDAEALQAAAGKMKGAAATVRSSGAAIKSTWAGLAGVYHAPESATLLAAMDPVATHTDTFAGDATSVAGILQTFADEAGPIAKTMATAKTDAAALENKIAGIDDWREDDDLVNQNNDLVKHVNSTLVAFQAAERRAANAIEALIGGHAFHAVDPNSEKQDKYAYGFASIPENARMPWGGKVEHKDGCFASTMTHIGHFFKGAAGALWGMVKGIGLFVWNGLGFGGWEAFKNQWVGLANMGIIGLFTLGPKEWARRNIAIGKELIHWDDWKNDPSKAAGETTVDLVTIFATGGGAAAAKGASTAGKVADVTEGASKASKVADVAGDAGKVSKVAKAGGLAKNGIKLFTKYGDLRNLPALSKLPRVGDVLAGLKTKMGDLTGLGHNKISDDLHLPHGDGPDPHASHASGDSNATGHVRSTTHAPEREPALAGAGTREGSGSHVGHDGGSHGSGGNSHPAPHEPGHSESHRPGDDSSAPSGGQGPETTPPHSGADAAKPTAGHEPASTRPGDGGPPTVAHEIHEKAPGTRTPFAERTDLEPHTAYHVEGRGTFYTDETGRVTYVETEAGRVGSLNGDLLHPQPHVTYVVDGRHVYHTDGLSRVDHVHVDQLQLARADRSSSVTGRIGREGGDGYEGGHLVAKVFGGGPEDHNIVAMLREVNRGSGDSFGNLEKQWAAQLKSDPSTKIRIEIEPVYSGSSRVPTEVDVSFSVNGGPTETRFYIND